MNFKQIADDSLDGKSLDGTLYYVSRAWLLQWSQRTNLDFPGEADFGPTTSIRCPHGELMPEQAAGAERVLVPENLWLFLYENFNRVRPENALTTFPSKSGTCVTCSMELNKVGYEDTLRAAAKLKERQHHKKILLESNDALNPGSKYYLLPSSWLTKWKSYITSGKMVPSPDPLEGVIDSLICRKHSLLLERPPDLFCKHGLIFQKPSTTDGLTIVSENDWKFFAEDWQGANSNCVSAEIEFSISNAKKLIGFFEEGPISEEDLNPSNDEVASRQPSLKTYPMVVKENQMLRVDARKIEEDSATLADMNIFPGAVLWVSDSGIYENRDTSEISGQYSCVKRIEGGFRGSLTANIVTQEPQLPSPETKESLTPTTTTTTTTTTITTSMISTAPIPCADIKEFCDKHVLMIDMLVQNCMEGQQTPPKLTMSQNPTGVQPPPLDDGSTILSTVVTSETIPCTDIKMFTDKYVVVIDMPGVMSEELNIQPHTANELVISGKPKLTSESGTSSSRYFRSRVTQRSNVLKKRLRLPIDAKIDSMSAVCERGVLRMTFPRRKISVSENVIAWKTGEENDDSSLSFYT
ncbi:ubiquitin carboxyl-terminal hydrolase 26-like isoform X2 [Papaver somniferum]|uniref:ubiquitin carboxyl-terminal hydrolase 26-like isoform X2 n=1 Tax=Papaver somniferum TaxID=3469 RepID=UPI000E6FA004|nr:ubiquitin carboxyl-terminal hydrolase 26-like isoform X2 [Papaver somniferum]